MMAHFERYIGIDYSGAETANSSCNGLRANSLQSINDISREVVHDPIQLPRLETSSFRRVDVELFLLLKG